MDEGQILPHQLKKKLGKLIDGDASATADIVDTFGITLYRQDIRQCNILNIDKSPGIDSRHRISPEVDCGRF
jgi:hypothetical protein